mmetsp:Transcript_6406/g.22907  ORF Transcript_6406/g.22907 Transcript_6406/m.22907 type:complete len:219 (-) Transcript_6406:186-842(-)
MAPADVHLPVDLGLRDHDGIRLVFLQDVGHRPDLEGIPPSCSREADVQVLYDDPGLVVYSWVLREPHRRRRALRLHPDGNPSRPRVGAPLRGLLGECAPSRRHGLRRAGHLGHLPLLQQDDPEVCQNTCAPEHIPPRLPHMATPRSVVVHPRRILGPYGPPLPTDHRAARPHHTVRQGHGSALHVPHRVPRLLLGHAVVLGSWARQDVLHPVQRRGHP